METIRIIFDTYTRLHPSQKLSYRNEGSLMIKQLAMNLSVSSSDVVAIAAAFLEALLMDLPEGFSTHMPLLYPTLQVCCLIT